MNAAAQNTINKAIIQQVCGLLGWQPDELVRYMVKIGKQYLQAHIPRDPGGIDALIQSGAFWNWWAVNWFQREQEFIERMQGVDEKMIPLCYLEAHNPYDLASTITPNGIVLSEAYAKFIGELFDNTKNTSHE